jgi:hypothetical protein
VIALNLDTVLGERRENAATLYSSANGRAIAPEISQFWVTYLHSKVLIGTTLSSVLAGLTNLLLALNMNSSFPHDPK